MLSKARGRLGASESDWFGNQLRRIVDNLPGATSFVTVDKSRKYYAAGFKLGYVENEVGAAFLPLYLTFV